MKAKFIKLAAVLLASGALLPQLTQAASDTWNQTAAGVYSWNANANWASGTQFPNGIGDVANLNINYAGKLTNNLNQAITVGTLNLGDSTSTYYSTTIGAGTAGSLTFDVSSGNAVLARTLNANPQINDVINANVTLNKSLNVAVPWINGGSSTSGYNDGIQINGIVSGAGGITLLNNTVAINNSDSQMLDLVNTANSFNGNVVVANGVMVFRGSVLKSQNSALGNAAAAIKVGDASATVAATAGSDISGFTTAELRLQAGDDTSNYSITRDVDFSGPTQGGKLLGRARLRLQGDIAGGFNSNTLTMGGNITLGSSNRAVEFIATRSGQTLYFTNDIITPANANGTIYWGPFSPDGQQVDGSAGGNYRFSDKSRSYTNSSQLLVCGTMVIEGSVGAVGTASPIGTSTIGYTDGNGGNITSNPGQDAMRSVFLATPGATFARSLSPGGGSITTYGGANLSVINAHRFGGLNTSGTVTFSGPITSTDPSLGANANNVITVGQNFALIQATGGTVNFAGVISDTPSASTVTRVTINQLRNHPSLDTNNDGFVDTGIANQLVGTPTSGTVILSATNTYQGGTEILGGTLLVNSATGSGTGSGTVTVQTNATLGGTGTIAGAVTFNSGSHAFFTVTPSGGANTTPLALNSTLAIATSGTIPDVHLALASTPAIGNYTLANYTSSGSSGTFTSTPIIDSGSLGGNLATVVTSGGGVQLQITSASVSTTTTVSTSGTPSTYGQSVTFTATIAPASGVVVPTGTVQFKTNGVALGSPVTVTTGVSPNGTASISTANLPVAGSPHTVTAEYTATGSFTSSTGTLSGGQTVNKATPTLTAPSAGSITYGQVITNSALSGGAATNSANNAVVTGSFAFTSPATVPNAGTASQAVTFTPTDTANYNTATTTVSLTVNQASLTITANSTNKVYDGVAFSGGNGVTYSAFVNGETNTALTGSLVYGGTSQGATNAGSYNITPSGLSNPNYNVAFVGGSLTITKAPASVTLGDLNQTYDGTAKSVTNATTPSGLTVNVTYAGSANAPTNAGTYEVIGTVADINYAGSATNDLVISPASLTITANNDSKVSGQTKTYGAGSTNFTSSGLQNSETVGSVTITATSSPTNGTAATDNVGSYVLTPSAATGGTFNPSNYSITYNTGTLSVIQASTFVGAFSTKNPSGYTDSVAYNATLPADASGNVVFLSPSGSFSTNTVSGGSASSSALTTLPRGTNVITVVYLGDSNYLGSTNSLNQVVTNHPPVASNVSYTRNAAVNTFKVLVSDLLTNASDVDGDTLSLVSVGATTNSATIMIGGGYVMYYNTNAVADQFSYTVTDGYGGTNTATVSIAIDSTPLFGQSQVGSVVGGTATLNFAGIPGYSYSVNRSTNLTDWVILWTTNAPASGVFQYIDNPAPMPSAYYRLQYNP